MQRMEILLKVSSLSQEASSLKKVGLLLLLLL